MKLKTSLLISLLMLTSVSSALNAGKPAEGKPEITFSETVHDFGVISEDGGPVSHNFEFTNTGDAPLMIVRASASCGCTRPDYPRNPIKSGKKDKIKVTYNPKGRPGEFTKTITVRTNSPKKKVTLKIKGTVTPAK